MRARRRTDSPDLDRIGKENIFANTRSSSRNRQAEGEMYAKPERTETMMRKVVVQDG